MTLGSSILLLLSGLWFSSEQMEEMLEPSLKKGLGARLDLFYTSCSVTRLVLFSKVAAGWGNKISFPRFTSSLMFFFLKLGVFTSSRSSFLEFSAMSCG